MTMPAPSGEPQDDVPHPYSEGFMVQVTTKDGDDFLSYVGDDEKKAVAYLNNLSSNLVRHAGGSQYNTGTRSQPIYFRDVVHPMTSAWVYHDSGAINVTMAPHTMVVPSDQITSVELLRITNSRKEKMKG